MIQMLSMFWGASLPVQFIMLSLLCASVWSWTIIFHKMTVLRTVTRKAERFEDQFWSGGSLEDLYRSLEKSHNNPAVAIFKAAMQEWKETVAKISLSTHDSRRDLIDRLESVMQTTLSRDIQAMNHGLNFLATLGNNGVIVGLLGTVIGFMYAMHGLGESHSASFVHVVPAITEALLATVMGLVAAIPAAFAYRKLSYDIKRFQSRMDIFIQEFLTLVSRQLSEEE